MLNKNALIAYTNNLSAYRISFTQLHTMHLEQLDQIMLQLFLSS